MPRLRSREFEQLSARVVAGSIRPLGFGIGLYYLVMSAAHLFVLPDETRLPMFSLALVGGVGLIAVGYWANRGDEIQSPHLVVGGIAAVAIVNSCGHLILSGEVAQSTNVAMVMIGGGLLMLSPRFVAFHLVFCWAGWAWGARSAWGGPEWTHFAFMLGSASVLTVLAWLIRARSLLTLNAVQTVLATKEEEQRVQKRLAHVQRLESLGRMAGGIAHDFNNLLTVIIGNADLAAIALDPESQARENVDEILSAAQKAARLTDQVLTYSGRRPTRPEDVRLKTLAAETVALIRSSAPPGVDVVRSFPDEELIVHGDPSQLRQIIVNLGINALEAIGDGPGKVHVELRTVREIDPRQEWLHGRITQEPYVEITVADDGKGMSVSERLHALDPFYSTKPGGRGLGLSVVAGIVSSLAGAVRIQSARNEGTVVSVAVPLAGQPVQSPMEPGLLLPTAADIDHGYILVVDDEVMVRNFVRKVLEGAQHDVLGASTGADALVLHRQHRDEISVVVIDLNLPDMTGVELLRMLRSQGCDAQIVFCTGEAHNRLLADIERSGQNRILWKPFTKEDVINAVGQPS